MNEIRFRVEHRPLTLTQRARIWWRGVKAAILETPPKTWGDFVQVKPGEFGYDKASYAARVDLSAPGYIVRDGKWEKIEKEQKFVPPNPAYYTPDAKV